MTENELNLLHRYLDGAITPEGLESLDERFVELEAARRARGRVACGADSTGSLVLPRIRQRH